MICSKSLVFEPQDTFEPLIKFAFKDCTQIAERSRDLRVVPEVFGVTCERVQEMRANNVIAPYVLRKVRRHYAASARVGRAHACPCTTRLGAALRVHATTGSRSTLSR